MHILPQHYNSCIVHVLLCKNPCQPSSGSLGPLFLTLSSTDGWALRVLSHSRRHAAMHLTLSWSGRRRICAYVRGTSRSWVAKATSVWKKKFLAACETRVLPPCKKVVNGRGHQLRFDLRGSPKQNCEDRLEAVTRWTCRNHRLGLTVLLRFNRKVRNIRDLVCPLFMPRAKFYSPWICKELVVVVTAVCSVQTVFERWQSIKPKARRICICK